jgi:hypothetical protein
MVPVTAPCLGSPNTKPRLKWGFFLAAIVLRPTRRLGLCVRRCTTIRCRIGAYSRAVLYADSSHVCNWPFARELDHLNAGRPLPSGRAARLVDIVAAIKEEEEREEIAGQG